MPNANYLAGRRFEYERMKYWRKDMGYDVMRTAGSRGTYDLIAIHPDHGVVLIQCKVVTHGAAADRLLEAFRNTCHIKGATQRLEIKIKGRKGIESFNV